MLQKMYESMKMRVEYVVERGKVGEEYIHGDREREALSKWTANFMRQDHPTVIQVGIIVSLQTLHVLEYFIAQFNKIWKMSTCVCVCVSGHSCACSDVNE